MDDGLNDDGGDGGHGPGDRRALVQAGGVLGAVGSVGGPVGAVGVVVGSSGPGEGTPVGPGGLRDADDLRRRRSPSPS